MRKDCCALVILLKTTRHDPRTTHFVTICSHKSPPPNKPPLLWGIRTFPVTQAYWRETKEGIDFPANLIKGEIKDCSCFYADLF